MVPGKNIQQAVPFFLVKDMVVSLDFYLKIPGSQLTNKWEPNGTVEWCWLQLDSAALMLQQYRNDPPQGAHGLGVTVCLICTDALNLYDELVAKGIQPAEPFVGNGSWVVEISDPDGYHLLFESPASEPEGTVLSAIRK